MLPINLKAYFTERFPELDGSDILEKYCSLPVEWLVGPKSLMTYNFRGDALIIWDMYVAPEIRGQYKAAEMADKLCETAKTKGYRTLIGFSEHGGSNKELGEAAMRSYGMRPTHKTADSTVWMKGI